MIEIDGSQYSGSGTIVRQAIALAALTRQPVHVSNVRVRRPQPGVRLQHVRVIEAIRELVGGDAGGVQVGSGDITFRPGTTPTGGSYRWDIGSAGSTTLLARALLPILAFAPAPSEAELHGGLFQDFAPSLFHLQHVMLPLLARMGLEAEVAMDRPGYVPRGAGILRLRVPPLRAPLQPLVLHAAGPLDHIWGIALASHLAERQVAARMAAAAQATLAAAGHTAAFELREDTSAPQAGRRWRSSPTWATACASALTERGHPAGVRRRSAGSSRGSSSMTSPPAPPSIATRPTR